MPSPSSTLRPSPLVPRRSKSTCGRKSPSFPDLNLGLAAKALGISTTWLGRILNGVHRPSMELAGKLAGYMGWTVDQVNSLYKQDSARTRTIKSSRKRKE